MKRSGWVLIGVLVLTAVVGWLVLRRSSENVVLDLASSFGQAVEVRPAPEAFSVAETTIAGVAKPAILTKENTRVAWSVTVPDRAWLHLSAAVQEPAWTTAGDGVVFRVSINDDELLNVVVNPYGDESQRKWQDYALDLSEFAGEQVRVYLKTNTSVPGKNNADGDLGAWGAPRIVTR
ncbi:MAG: hypothetical protein IT184_08240 [Acidobacteria bacterium]|nr:hypothetical protein [Acidobacteriota bacterium]